MGTQYMCMSCLSRSSIEYVEAAQASLCTKCGAIAAEDSLRSDANGIGPTREPNGFSWKRQQNDTKRQESYNVNNVMTLGRRHLSRTVSHQARRRMEFSKWITNMLTALGLESCRDRVVLLFEHAFKMRTWKWGHQAELVACSCAYIAAREISASHSLVQVADVACSSVYDVGRVYVKVKQDLAITINDPEPLEYVDRLMNYIARSKIDPTALNTKFDDHLKSFIQSFEPNDLRDVCIGVLRLVHTVGLGTGRKANAVGAAVVLLAMEALTCKKLQGVTVLAEGLSQVIQASHYAVLARYKELHSYCMEFAKLLPYIKEPDKTVTKGRLPEFILDIMFFWDQIMENRPPKVAKIDADMKADIGILYPEDQELWPFADLQGQGEDIKVPIKRSNNNKTNDKQSPEPEDTLTAPPAYKRSHELRQRRENMLNVAKARLIRGLSGPSKKAKLDVDDESLVHLLQQLLLAGIDESLILTTRNVDQLRDLWDVVQRSQNNNSELVNDEEIQQYLRSKEEIKKVEQFQNQEYIHGSRKKVHRYPK